jgi:hypothetical protein
MVSGRKCTLKNTEDNFNRLISKINRFNGVTRIQTNYCYGTSGDGNFGSGHFGSGHVGSGGFLGGPAGAITTTITNPNRNAQNDPWVIAADSWITAPYIPDGIDMSADMD